MRACPDGDNSPRRSASVSSRERGMKASKELDPFLMSERYSTGSSMSFTIDNWTAALGDIRFVNMCTKKNMFRVQPHTILLSRWGITLDAHFAESLKK